MGLLIELACYSFDPPPGATRAEVLLEAHRIQIARREAMIRSDHIADAIERLIARKRASLSADRGPRQVY